MATLKTSLEAYVPLSPAMCGDSGQMSLALTFSSGALDAYSDAFVPYPNALPKSQVAHLVELGALKPNSQDLGAPKGLKLKLGEFPFPNKAVSKRAIPLSAGKGVPPRANRETL